MSENNAARMEGGRRVTGSGNKREKGDVRNEVWRIEDKFTEHDSYRLALPELDKIIHEALMTPPGLLPQMRITMAGRTFRVLREEDWLWVSAVIGAQIFDNKSPMPGEPS